MEIREFAWPDYEAVAALWQRLGMWKPDIDSREALAVTLTLNPGLFLVAADPDAPGGIAGTTIGTWDGRRAYLYHVAVDPACRRRGVGRALVRAVLQRLRERGAPKVRLHVHSENHGAIAFYETLGLRRDSQVAGMSLELNRET